MLSINIKYIEDLDLSINEVLCLYKIKYPELNYNDVSGTYKGLQEKKFIKIYTENNEVQMLLREKSEQLLEDMESQCPPADEKLVKKVSARHVNNMLDGNIQTFRNKWKGLAPGAMGAKQACTDKLKRWIAENPEYTFEDILKACDIYIKTFNGSYRYLQRADYFIFKKDGKEESSRLSAFIEEIDIEITDDDWTSEVS
jgi:hypothetical protein